ncbi:MAG: methyl-accepting chemotaxis protein [Verrucomicrobiota bacterium]
MSMKRVQFFVFSVMTLTLMGLILISVVSYRGMGQINGAYEKIVRSEIPKLSFLQSITYESSTVQRKLLLLIIAANNSDQEIQLKSQKSIEEARKKNKEYFQQLESLIYTEEEKRNLEEIKLSWGDYNQKVDRLIEVALQGKVPEAYSYNISTVLPAFNRYQELLEKFVALTEGLSNKKGGEISGEAGTVQNETWMMGIVVFIIGFFGACFTNWNLRSAMKKLTQISQSIEEGSAQTASASGEVSSSSQSLAHGASEQAASLQETSASLEEMSSMTRRNAENAHQVKVLANQAREAGDRGVMEMSSLKVAMSEIQASGNEISKIIKTIDEIAFQTNILALNAAVEAARAGSAGAGFSVVADEVRSLAQRSAMASRETSEKIEGAIRKAQHGGELTLKVAESLEMIVDKSKAVDHLIGEITSASDEQNRGVTQINMAVGQMDKVTQSSAASAEETAAAAEQLSSQAVTLRGLISDLNEIVGGDVAAITVHSSQVSHSSHDFKKTIRPISAVKKERPEIKTLPAFPLPKVSAEKKGDDFFKDSDSFRDMT